MSWRSPGVDGFSDDDELDGVGSAEALGRLLSLTEGVVGAVAQLLRERLSAMPKKMTFVDVFILINPYSNGLIYMVYINIATLK